MRRVVVTCCVLSLMAFGSVRGDDDEDARVISVSGQGKVSAPPDMATIYTGVVTQAETAAEALAANSRAMESVMDVLKSHRIASKDIQTSGFSVSPVYRRGPRGQVEPTIVGYRVENQVRVRVRNLPVLGEVLDALVQAGSNRVSGVSFGVDDPTGVLDQARNRAVADARHRAELYAQAAGVRLGKIRSISEQPAIVPQPMRLGFAGAEAAAAVPVAPGELEFQATIHVVYELLDADGS